MSSFENEVFSNVNVWIEDSFESCQYNDVKFQIIIDENAMEFDFKATLDIGLALTKSKLTRAEFMFILDVLQGAIVKRHLATWFKETLVYCCVSKNTLFVNSRYVKWDVDKQVLLDKVSDLTYLETWALLDYVERCSWEPDKTCLDDFWALRASGHIEPKPGRVDGSAYHHVPIIS
jgi:hypothetical protein